MFSQIHTSYGFTKNYQSTERKLFYINGNKIKKGNYYNPSDGTSISTTKELAMKKSYSEYLERFLLGVGGFTAEGKYISYGKTSAYGYIDTTGTATGIESCQILKKALSELIEKNELFFLWYTDIGERLNVELSNEQKQLIKSLNFRADEHLCLATRNLSNYYTVITISLYKRQITGCGISCNQTIEEAVKKSIIENKIIEWQNYQNEDSRFYQSVPKDKEKIYDFIFSKIEKRNSYHCEEGIDNLIQKKLMLNKDIPFPEVVILNGKNNHKNNVKTIKLVSKHLLNCLPSKRLIRLSKKQKIISNIDYNATEFDCFLV